MKNKIKWIIIGVLIVIISVLLVLCIRFWNTIKVVTDWDNIVSFYNSQRYDTKEIEKKLDENKQKMETIAEQSPNINIRGDLTDEEKKALEEGKITKEEATLIVKGDTTLEEILKSKEDASTKEEVNNTEDANKEEPTPNNNPPQDKPALPDNQSERASELVSELYVLQADFIARLEAVGDSAYADYKAISYKRDQIPAIIDSYMGTVGAMEAECDKKVNALLKELDAELVRVNGDRSIVNEIRKFYYQEKSLKKTYYLNKLDDEDYK